MQSKTFKTDNFSFTFPNDWRQEKENTTLDLKCLTYDEDLYTGVLEYDKADFADNISPENALSLYIDEVMAKCDNPEFIEVMKEAEFEDFEKFAIIVQSITPSQFEKYKSTYEDIVGSCQHIQLMNVI